MKVLGTVHPDVVSTYHNLGNTYRAMGDVEQAIHISLRKADLEQNEQLRYQAFTYAEESKSVLLQAQIKASGAVAFSGIPPSILEQEHDLQVAITWREKQRQSLLDKGVAETDTAVLRISSALFDLKREYDTLRQYLKKNHNKYYIQRLNRNKTIAYTINAWIYTWNTPLSCRINCLVKCSISCLKKSFWCPMVHWVIFRSTPCFPPCPRMKVISHITPSFTKNINSAIPIPPPCSGKCAIKSTWNNP